MKNNAASELYPPGGQEKERKGKGRFVKGFTGKNFSQKKFFRPLTSRALSFILFTPHGGARHGARGRGSDPESAASSAAPHASCGGRGLFELRRGEAPHPRSDQILYVVVAIVSPALLLKSTKWVSALLSDKKITMVQEGANKCLHLFSFLNFCRYIV